VVLVVVSWSLASTGARRKLAEMELRKHRDHLEVLVAARTAELTTLNKQFQVVGVLRRQDIAKRKRVELELTSSRQQLRNLAVHTQSAREEERKSVARQVHDELGQLLTVLKMDLSWLGKRLPEERILLLEKTKTMSKLVDKTIQTVRRISTELRPGLLDDLGLIAAIEWHAEEFQNWTGIKCKVTSDCANAILGQDLSTTIFRVFQETLLNVARHANATEVKVSLRKEDGRLALEISDNGIGITKEEIADPKSFGLIGIRERILSWEGKVDIRGTPNNGTTVTASIPLDRGGVVQC
jgi:signal transduction histidine kinase